MAKRKKITVMLTVSVPPTTKDKRPTTTKTVCRELLAILANIPDGFIYLGGDVLALSAKPVEA